MRMAPSVAWAPPSLTLPRKGGGDEIAGSTSLSLMPSALSLIPSPLRGEGKGGGGAASRPLDFETRIRT
jgi:hypothetical protein